MVVPKLRMNLRVFADARQAATEAASHIAERAREAVNAKGSFTLALSGGRSPRIMFEALAAAEVPWPSVELFQVDERLVPADSSERNFGSIRELLVDAASVPRARVHAMPVDGGDPREAAIEYGQTLRRVLGAEGRLDLVHLGLGADGHTASLLPGDPAVEAIGDVILSRPYQGHRRLSLSRNVLSASRERLWLVTGGDKQAALAALLDGRLDAPAGRLERGNSVVFADRAAAPPDS